VPERRVVIVDVDGMHGIGGVLPADALAVPEFSAVDGVLYKLIAVRDRYVLYAPQQRPTNP
jgi:hypothetical protein